MKVQELTGSTLAYMGDAIWSLIVRKYLINQGFTKAKDLQQRSVAFVSAKAQARYYYALSDQHFFTEEELEIFKRGRNFKSGSVPKNTDVQTYCVSTGFEAVLGALYLEEKWERIEAIWDEIKTQSEE